MGCDLESVNVPEVKIPKYVDNSMSVVTGGTMIATGIGLCDTGLGCALGGPMTVHGAGKVQEGITGIVDQYRGGAGVGDNAVRNAYEGMSHYATGDSRYGYATYYGFDTALTVLSLRVPKPMNVSNPGSLPARSIFGATKSEFSNPKVIPGTNIVLPYGVQQVSGVKSVLSNSVEFGISVFNPPPKRPCMSIMCSK